MTTSSLTNAPSPDVEASTPGPDARVPRGLILVILYASSVAVSAIAALGLIATGVWS